MTKVFKRVSDIYIYIICTIYKLRSDEWLIYNFNWPPHRVWPAAWEARVGGWGGKVRRGLAGGNKKYRFNSIP